MVVFVFFFQEKEYFVLRELYISLEDRNCKNFENDSFLTARWGQGVGDVGREKEQEPGTSLQFPPQRISDVMSETRKLFSAIIPSLLK